MAAAKSAEVASCLDENVACLQGLLAEKRFPTINSANAGLQGTQDEVLLAWLRKTGWMWVTRDEKRVLAMWKSGLLHDRPGIILLHSPKGDAEDLVHLMNAFLIGKFNYVELWGRAVYISHDKVRLLFADGTEETLAQIN